MADTDARDREYPYEDAVSFYAGRLASSRERSTLAWVTAHPDAAARARRDAAIEQRIARQYEAVLDEPIPPRLLRYGHRRRARWPMRMGTAAAVAVAAGIGWWGGTQQMPSPERADGFVQRVAAAADGDGPDGTPVVSTAGAQTSPGGGNALPAPDLGAQGYDMVARRHVDDAGGGRDLGEFVYENDLGQRVRLFAQRREPVGEPSPRVSFEGGRPLARWQANGVDYALVGEMPADSLRSLARIAAAGRPAEPAPVQPVGRPVPSKQGPAWRVGDDPPLDSMPSATPGVTPRERMIPAADGGGGVQPQGQM